MDEKLDELFWRDMSRLTVRNDIFMTLYNLLTKIHISDNSKRFVVYKLKLNSQKLGWVYNTVTSTAIKYGVPRIYIKECSSVRTSYKFYKTYPQFNSTVNLTDIKRNMNSVYEKLIVATYQLILEKQSRKEKIYKLLENMKNN